MGIPPLSSLVNSMMGMMVVMVVMGLLVYENSTKQKTSNGPKGEPSQAGSYGVIAALVVRQIATGMLAPRSMIKDAATIDSRGNHGATDMLGHH